jgi:tetratricopeptide (TPR) repeat protein
VRRVVLVAGLAAACGPKTIDHPVVEDIAGLLPAALEPQKPRATKGDPRTLVIRVWVDAAIRGDTGWKDKLTEELDYANQFLGPFVGVTLETQSIQDWDKRPELGSALEDLAATDPGDDAAWVIGYIAAPTESMTALGELGAGDPLGKHVIVRGWAAGPETDELQPKLPKLPAAEKAEVLGAHRRHKQSVILLHFLARTLGAVAETDAAWIQNNAYSPKQTTFSERNRELIQLGVDARVAKTPAAETAMQLLAAIEASEYGGWLAADKDSVVGRLRNVIDAAKAGETAADVPAAAYSQFDHARTLARRQQFDDAIAELEPLIAAYPANATMRILVCDIELHRAGPTAAAAKKACDRAIELAAGDPRPHVTIAAAWLAKNDLAAARAELLLAEGKVGNLPKPAQGWLELAEIYRAMGALTWAEAAVAKSGATDHPVLAWAKTTRTRYGVPPSGKGAVKPEDEAAAVTAVRQVLDAVYASKFADAARAVKTANKRYPGLPGVAAAWCDLDLRQEHIGSAKKRCAQAIDAYPEASWAQYLMGIIIMKDTGSADTKEGIEHLKRAIAADPDLGQAWRALGKAYKRAKDAEALQQLETDYQARFGQALGD